MLNCAACGKDTKGGISLGGTLLCRECAADVEIEIERLRAEGKQVNVAIIARKMFRESCVPGGYLLRDIPKKLWDKAKNKAVDKGITLRELILQAVKEFIDRD
jgi:hypothetical protein